MGDVSTRLSNDINSGRECMEVKLAFSFESDGGSPNLKVPGGVISYDKVPPNTNSLGVDSLEYSAEFGRDSNNEINISRRSVYVTERDSNELSYPRERAQAPHNSGQFTVTSDRPIHEVSAPFDKKHVPATTLFNDIEPFHGDFVDAIGRTKTSDIYQVLRFKVRKGGFDEELVSKRSEGAISIANRYPKDSADSFRVDDENKRSLKVLPIFYAEISSSPAIFEKYPKPQSMLNGIDSDKIIRSNKLYYPPTNTNKDLLHKNASGTFEVGKSNNSAEQNDSRAFGSQEMEVGGSEAVGLNELRSSTPPKDGVSVMQAASVNRSTPMQSNGIITGTLHQIADTAARISEGTVELKLYPEELGRVRMFLVSGETGLTVNILADRPETLELMRRNADELARHLADAGFEGAGFSFGQDHREDENQDSSTALSLGADDTVEESVESLSPESSDDSLDLRM